jgi:hypothetical protein
MSYRKVLSEVNVVILTSQVHCVLIIFSWQPMVNGALYVAEYRPQGGNVRHWALYLEVHDGGSVHRNIYQVVGPAKGFEHSMVPDVAPAQSGRFVKNIHVSDLDDRDTIQSVREILGNQAVRNDIATWSCQDWVMEALETLSEEQLLDEFSYADARATLDNDYNN